MRKVTIDEVNDLILDKLKGRNRFLSSEFEIKTLNDISIIFQIFSLSANKRAEYFIDFSSIGNKYVTIRNETYRVPTFTIFRRSHF